MLQMWLHYVIKIEGFPKFRFSVPTLLCAYMSEYLCDGWTEFDENLTPGVKSPVDFKYDVRIDVWYLSTQATFEQDLSMHNFFDRSVIVV